MLNNLIKTHGIGSIIERKSREETLGGFRHLGLSAFTTFKIYRD